MRAIGANGPFTLNGVDRVRTRDGLVCENVINFDGGVHRLAGSGPRPVAR